MAQDHYIREGTQENESHTISFRESFVTVTNLAFVELLISISNV